MSPLTVFNWTIGTSWSLTAWQQWIFHTSSNQIIWVHYNCSIGWIIQSCQMPLPFELHFQFWLCFHKYYIQIVLLKIPEEHWLGGMRFGLHWSPMKQTMHDNGIEGYDMIQGPRWHLLEGIVVCTTCIANATASDVQNQRRNTEISIPIMFPLSSVKLVGFTAFADLRA